MKKFYVFMMMFLIVTTTTFAQNRGQVEEARVLSSSPVFTEVRVNDPQEQCYQRRVPMRNYNHYDDYGQGDRSHTGTIVGGLVGGAITNEIFKDHKNRDAATVVGALVGGALGNDYSHRRNRGGYGHRARPRHRMVTECETINHYRYEEQLSGYNVTFEYNGRQYTGFTKTRPGDTVLVRINISLVE